MPIRLDQLPKDPAELAKMVVAMAAEIDKLTAMVEGFRTMIYGARSERMATVVADKMTLDLGGLPLCRSPKCGSAQAPQTISDSGPRLDHHVDGS